MSDQTEAQFEYWFRPKSRGYGAIPIHWKGWALMVGVVAALAIETWLLIDFRGETTPLEFAAWGAVVIATMIAYRRVAQARTNGEWRFRKGAFWMPGGDNDR